MSYIIAPEVDIVRRTDHYELLVNLPGFNKEDVSIETPSLQEIILKGSLSHELNEEKCDSSNEAASPFHEYVLRERPSGKLYRRIKLPVNVDVDNIAASLEKGVLRAKLPILDVSHTKKATINWVDFLK